jgi:hypothetical protein
LSQIDFLENCKKNLPISTLENMIKVASWSLDGIPILDKDSSVTQVQKPETLQEINREIILLEIDANTENLAKYQRTSRSSNINFDRRVKNALSLHSKTSGKKTSFP